MRFVIWYLEFRFGMLSSYQPFTKLSKTTCHPEPVEGLPWMSWIRQAHHDKNIMIISISGNEGSGKSTAAKALSEKLGMKRYYMGAIRRQKAAERGMTLDEYNKLGETDPTTDTEVEDYIKHLGATEANFIIESRTAWHFIPHSLKVFLQVDPREGARRIVEHLKEDSKGRNETNYQTIEEAVAGLAARKESDRKRYLKYYGIDIFNPANFDLIIDTTSISPEETLERIIQSIPSK